MGDSVGKYKNFLVVVGAGLLIAGAFLLLSRETETESGAAVALSQETLDRLAESEEIEREIIQELARIRQIRIGNDVYDDPAFLSLVDFTEIIEPQDVLRVNPFAPLE